MLRLCSLTLCTCAAVGRKEWFWAAGKLSVPVSFGLWARKWISEWTEVSGGEKEIGEGGAGLCEQAMKRKVRVMTVLGVEGAIRLNEWLLSDRKCTSWKCPVYREGPCDHRPSSLEASVWSQTSWPTTKGSHCVATSPPIQQLSSKSANKHN